MEKDVSHREIYDRLVAVETKVDRIGEDTKDVVSAFESAKGAFVVLEFMGKFVKPVLWLIGFGSAVAILWTEFWKRP
jgi:hypothetical protein